MQVPYYTDLGFTIGEELHFSYTNKLVQSLKKRLLRGEKKLPPRAFTENGSLQIYLNFQCMNLRESIRNQFLNNNNML